jgi:hypothetical protein
MEKNTPSKAVFLRLFNELEAKELQLIMDRDYKNPEQ